MKKCHPSVAFLYVVGMAVILRCPNSCVKPVTAFLGAPFTMHELLDNNKKVPHQKLFSTMNTLYCSTRTVATPMHTQTSTRSDDTVTVDDDNGNSHQRQTQQQQYSNNRRTTLSTFLGLTSSYLLVPVQRSPAGEVGARITKAVTTSDLGISVRTSVVKGAQVFDKIDGQWEGFSDKYGLGAGRNKQVGRPAPKVIPDPLPLDTTTAVSILKAADEVFLSLMTPLSDIKATQLEEQISRVAGLVRPSFERSGVDLGDNVRDVKTAPQFNFASYVHFKAYSDLILLQSKSFDFNGFRRNFEAQLGQKLVNILLPQTAKGLLASTTSQPTEQILNSKLKSIDQFCDMLKEKGFVSLTERSPLEQDQISDWVGDMSDLTFTIALDGDITLGTQMLLQEQGFRLYPDYARFGVLALLQGLAGQRVQIDDYYFDTDYNSDPDKFEVKEVVLNVVLDSA